MYNKFKMLSYTQAKVKTPFLSLETIRYVSKNGSKTLGVGSSGFVELITSSQDLSKMYALKTINIQSAAIRANIIEEIRLQSNLKHPNIIQLYNSQIQENKAYIFLEYAKNGDLFHALYNNLPMSMKSLLKIFYQTTKAIQYMHSKGILHRDLKPENILLDDFNNAKLCDFGWSVELSAQYRRQSLCGTTEYMAPEIYGKQKQTEKTDVWALGN